MLLLTSLLVLSQATSAHTGRPIVHAVDVNSDGIEDQVRSYPDHRVVVALGLGRRQFEAVPQVLPKLAVSGLLAADLDGDGNLDLYLLSPGANRVLLGHGDGTFEAAPGDLGLSDRGMARAAELRDLDADGIPDVLLRNRTGDVFFWGLGLGRYERDPLTPEDAAEVAIAGGRLVERATLEQERSVEPGRERGASSSGRTPVPAGSSVAVGSSSGPGRRPSLRSSVGSTHTPGQPATAPLPSKLQTPALPAGSVLLWDKPSAPKGFQLLSGTVRTEGTLPSWSSGPSAPISWNFPWGGAVGHRLLVAEGSGGTAIRAFDATTQTWTSAPSLSQAIGNRGCAAIGDSLYCVGGATASASLTRVDVYDAGTNTWSSAAPLPAPLHTMGVAAAGGMLYVFGGADQGTGSFSDKIYSYDPGTNSWTQLGATLSRVRTVAAAATVGTDVLLFGGSAAPSFPVVTITWVERFDTTTGTLTKLSSGGPQSSFDRGSAVVEGTDVHVFGFVNGGNTRHDIYHAETDTWTAGIGPASAPPLDIGGLVDGNAYVVEQSGSNLHAFGNLATTLRLIEKK